VDGARIPPNKPMVMKDGTTVQFGDGTDGPAYVVRCESAAEKRRGDGGSEQQVQRQRSTVRCSHLLVKHCQSRRPASWKVR